MVLPLLSHILVLLFVYYLDVSVRYGYIALFVIVHVRCCPAAMVPVAATWKGSGLEASIQSPEKVVKGNTVVSVIVKEPESNVISWLPPPLSSKPGGLGLLPVILISNCPVPVLSQSPGLAGSTQTLLTVRVPVAGTAVFLIVHVRCCPAAMLPVASCELEEDCVQSPEKEVVKAGVESSDTVKEPDFSPTAWLFPLLRENDDG
jgi:hypothetical protein